MSTIRTARADDAVALAELAAATFPLACPPGTPPESIAEHLATHLSADAFTRWLVDPGTTVLVVEDGELIGYTMLIAGDPGDPDVAVAVTDRPTVELSKVYVLADRHGGGVARELMAATLDRAATDGAASVWLGVNQGNARAIRFYTKSGFAVAGSRAYRVGPQVMRDHVMVARPRLGAPVSSR